MNESNTIKNWHEDDRPREKMMRNGASALTDAELLAILIGSGTPDRSALVLARETLEMAQHNLRELGKLSLADLQKVNGVGPARSIIIAAAMELGRRRQIADGLELPKISKSRDAAEILMPLLQDLEYERFYAMYLNNACKVLRYEPISSGGMAATVVDVRMILKGALLNNAVHLIIAHNHPSGTKRPSEQDIILTRKIKESAATMDIKLIDHLIIAGTEFLSMSDDGFM